MVPSRAKLVLSCILHNIPKLRGMPYISPRKETVFRFEKRFPVKLVTSVDVGTGLRIETGTIWEQEYTSIGQWDGFFLRACLCFWLSNR